MRCHRLQLQGFRAYDAATFHFGPGLNVLHGPNGAGKTNVLEAIHYLALARSFVTAQDAYAVRVGAKRAELRGEFESDRGGALAVRLLLGGDTGKTVTHGGAPLATLSEHVGRIPVVVMAPQDHALTAEGPEERRRFLNNLIGQARPVYLDDLLRYTRALRQRNELLASGRSRRYAVPPDLLASWTEEVARLGARLVHARAAALDRFTAYLDAAYERLGERIERPSLRYAGPVEVAEGADAERVADALRERFATALLKEREAGRTLVGPHRDEVVFRLGSFDVRRYASQGQHRTFGVALRLAQFFYLRDLTGETPLLLLDDLFGNLDPARTALLLAFLQSDEVGQSFVTQPDLAAIAPHIALDGERNRALAVPPEDTNGAAATVLEGGGPVADP